MSSGVTPWCRPPSAIATLWETGVRMPIRRASRATFLGPTRMPTWTYTELSEYVVASDRVRTPAYSLSKLLTVKCSPPLRMYVCLADVQVEPGLIPRRSASDSTNGLNEDPGWRWPCVARLNGLEL